MVRIFMVLEMADLNERLSVYFVPEDEWIIPFSEFIEHIVDGQSDYFVRQQ